MECTKNVGLNLTNILNIWNVQIFMLAKSIYILVLVNCISYLLNENYIYEESLFHFRPNIFLTTIYLHKVRRIMRYWSFLIEKFPLNFIEGICYFTSYRFWSIVKNSKHDEYDIFRVFWFRCNTNLRMVCINSYNWIIKKFKSISLFIIVIRFLVSRFLFILVSIYDVILIL